MVKKVQEKIVNQPTLSVVVPLYNEERIVKELLRRIVKACSTCTSQFEVIIVNDGSIDSTKSLLIAETDKYPEIVIVDLSRNYGHMSAISAGLNIANGKAVVIMDGDLQDPPELIPKLVKKWKKGAEVVLACRTKRYESFWQRSLTAIFYRILSNVAEVHIPSQVGTFSLLDHRIAEIIKQMPERMRYFAGLRAWLGFHSEIIEYQRPKRAMGKSRVSFGGLVKLARISIISFSNKPLTWMARLSLVGSMGLLTFGLTVIGIKYFTQLAIPGWASTMVLVGSIGALQSAVLAVLCEYIAVIFDEIKQRPQFLINSIYRNGRWVKFIPGNMTISKNIDLVPYQE